MGRIVPGGRWCRRVFNVEETVHGVSGVEKVKDELPSGLDLEYR